MSRGPLLAAVPPSGAEGAAAGCPSVGVCGGRGGSCGRGAEGSPSLRGSGEELSRPSVRPWRRPQGQSPLPASAPARRQGPGTLPPVRAAGPGRQRGVPRGAVCGFVVPQVAGTQLRCGGGFLHRKVALAAFRAVNALEAMWSSSDQKEQLREREEKRE